MGNGKRAVYAKSSIAIVAKRRAAAYGEFSGSSAYLSIEIFYVRIALAENKAAAAWQNIIMARSAVEDLY